MYSIYQNINKFIVINYYYQDNYKSERIISKNAYIK